MEGQNDQYNTKIVALTMASALIKAYSGQRQQFLIQVNILKIGKKKPIDSSRNQFGVYW